MLFFRNSEVVETYHVSLRTVLNWIEAAKQGKLNLQIYTEGERSYIARTKQNEKYIEDIVRGRRKYRNHRGLKNIKPSVDFYTTFNQEQIYDIITSLEVHHEIPRQYNYFGEGGNNWNKYALRLAAEGVPNILNSTIKLLHDNGSYIDAMIKNHKKVNVVDIGVGNALPVREFLSNLIDRHILGRYIALDISTTMLDVAHSNLKNWFGEDMPFEGHEIDVAYQRFGPLLASEQFQEDAGSVVNIILFLGGTPINLRRPSDAFRTIVDSMGRDDFLIYTEKVDSERSRKYFDFYPELPAKSPISPNHRLVLDLLNIEPQFYDVEMGFDATIRQRYTRIRLKVALSLEFYLFGGYKKIELNKGETILLWRAWHTDPLGLARQFDESDFHLMHSSQTEDQEYILTISRVKRD